jgi:hypothetical protein
MQATETNEQATAQKSSSVGKRLAILFCILASAIGWAAILGLVLLLKPELPF